ncbi:MAG: hydroxyacylglutathione hydrolase [Spirochaetaceae bacterium]
MLHILQILETNYCYIIERDSEIIIVDPGESDAILSFIVKNKFKPKTILLTHNHIDHCGGLENILEIYPNLDIIDFNSKTDTVFNTKEDIQVIKTPGHTKDSCCFYFPNREIIFTGDTLFSGLCGRLLGGTYQDYFSSLNLLKELPTTTKIYPGHEYLNNSIDFLLMIEGNTSFYYTLKAKRFPSTETTIGDEIAHNPFLTSDFNKFKELRKLKG